MAAGWRLVLAICVLGLVTACSVASYQKPVGEFAKATEDADQAFKALNQRVTQAYAERIRADILAGNRIVLAESGDCGLTSERCRLVAFKQDGSSESFDPDPLLGKMATLMGLIADYAKGLADIVNADTTEKVATHVNSTLGSVENLSKTVDKELGSKTAATVSAYKTSVGKAINWLVGQYVASVQVDGLRKATAAADPVIQEAMSIFESAATLAADISNAKLQREFEVALQRYENDEQEGRSSAREKNIDTLSKKAAEYDRILMAKPANVYGKLAESHAALTANLRGDEVTLVTVAARIEIFAAEVKALIEIVRQVSETKVG